MAHTVSDWLITFWKILTLPTPKTFLQESEKADGKMSSALGWAVFIAFYSFFLLRLAGMMFGIGVLVGALLVFPIFVVLLPSTTHFILQRFFHRKQYLYDRLLYMVTAILVLFQLIIIPMGLLGNSTLVNGLVNLLYVYQCFLIVVAIKAIANVRYWQAIVTALLTIFAGAIILICALPVITSLMGGVAGTLR